MPPTRTSEPASVSDPTSEPVVTLKVSAGSASPYVFNLFAAVTVMSRGSMVRFADTKLNV